MNLSFKLRKATGDPLQALPARGRYSMLAEVTRQEAPATGAGGKRRCAGNSIKIHPASTH
jgi:hypothetical protein